MSYEYSAAILAYVSFADMDAAVTGEPGPLARAARLVKWTVVTITFLGLVLLAGVGIVALLGRDGSDRTWSRWGNVGDAFGALNSLLSGLAVAAIVVTFLVQFQELKVQRTDLARQRDSLNRAESELRRSAEAKLRMLHVDLMKMAMDDTSLAEVWPPLAPRLSHEENKQYFYANLILQHAWLQLRINVYTEAEMHSYLRYVFTSPIMREYWQISMRSRNRILVPGTAEFLFNEAADAICREYEDVLTCARPQRTPDRPPPEPALDPVDDGLQTAA